MYELKYFVFICILLLANMTENLNHKLNLIPLVDIVGK